MEDHSLQWRLQW